MITLQLFIILAGLLGSAFYAGIETGIISIHRMRLEHSVRQGTKGTEKLQGYLDNPNRLLGTTLVGNNICLVAISVLSASLAVRFLGEWGETISSGIMGLVILVACEYIPKAWFLSRPLERCSRFVGILRLSELVLLPASRVTIWLTKGLVPGPSKSFSEPVPLVTKEDLKVLAREGEKGGELSARERFMIHRVFELSHKRAHEIMVPRSHMTIFESDVTLAEFFDNTRESGFTRFPVCSKSTNEFVGIINVFSVLSTSEAQHNRPVADFLRVPLFIKQDMPVDDILPRLRHSRQPMCLVTNNSGEVTGLITIEDILEEIVGTL